jgi:serine/threonine protein kinase
MASITTTSDTWRPIATNTEWLLSPKDISIGRELGRGTFGVVYHGFFNNMEVAIKQIASSATPDEVKGAEKLLRNEVKALARCRHKNIVQLIGACSNPPMLVLEYAAKGTLLRYLSENRLTPAEKIRLIKGICDGMIMLHSRDILHLDLKPENILINENDIPLVADFGLAIAITTTMSAARSSKGARGTIPYKAPEHYSKKSTADDSDDDSSDDGETKSKPAAPITYGKPADVYSFGMMCWQIFSGKEPFHGKAAHTIISLHIRALSGGKVKRPSLKNIPSEVKPFIEACWSQDPQNRPTFASIRLHWLKPLLLNANERQSRRKKPKIFLSYRRTHSDSAGRLKKELNQLGYDNVFFDIDGESLGAGEFQGQLEDALANADVLIAMVTPAPSGPQDRVHTDGGRFNMTSFETMRKYAHDQRTDYCAVEIERALTLNKLVIPVYNSRQGANWIGDQMAHLNDYPIRVGSKVKVFIDGRNDCLNGDVIRINNSTSLVSYDLKLMNGETVLGVGKSRVVSTMSTLKHYQRYGIPDELYSEKVKQIDGAIMNWWNNGGNDGGGDVKRRMLREFNGSGGSSKSSGGVSRGSSGGSSGGSGGSSGGSSSRNNRSTTTTTSNTNTSTTVPRDHLIVSGETKTSSLSTPEFGQKEGEIPAEETKDVRNNVRGDGCFCSTRWKKKIFLTFFVFIYFFDESPPHPHQIIL